MNGDGPENAREWAALANVSANIMERGDHPVGRTLDRDAFTTWVLADAVDTLHIVSGTDYTDQLDDAETTQVTMPLNVVIAAMAASERAGVRVGLFLARAMAGNDPQLVDKIERMAQWAPEPPQPRRVPPAGGDDA